MKFQKIAPPLSLAVQLLNVKESKFKAQYCFLLCDYFVILTGSHQKYNPPPFYLANELSIDEVPLIVPFLIS